MKKGFSVPRGTSDILPAEAILWQEVESIARRVLNVYSYKEIRTPLFEETELFARSMGQTSDVVNKQMLSLQSQKQSEADDIKTGKLSLRPEGTASIVRSYIENSLDKKEPLSKLYYIGPMFRGERPQKGRLRQFHQIGVEAIGPDSLNPYLDAEVISLCVNLLKALGVKNFNLKINTLGTQKDKENFSKWLRKELKADLSKLDIRLQKSFNENIFRILDSKDQKCQAIVEKLELDYSYLSEESKEYFNEVKEALDNLNVEYQQTPSLVRGLDYYTQTVFEISESSLGSQDALGAGGRYNNLVTQLGGPEVDAVGFALGIERILLVMPQGSTDNDLAPNAFLVALDAEAFKRAFELLNMLRDEGVSCDISYRSSSMKSQMRQADKSGARYVLILGEDEIKKGVVTIKDMQEGTQSQEQIADIGQIISTLTER